MSQNVQRQCGLDCLKPYVPGKPIEEVKREYGLDDVIKLASNENPLGTSPKAIAAMEAALTGVNVYPDGQSYELRQALARRFDVSMDYVTAGNGADGLILGICMAFLEEESEVVVSVSSFPVYDIYTHIMRAELVKTPLKEHGLDLEAMADAINERTRVVFVCNPNNPTGTIVSADEVDRFMERVPDHVLVVFDEAYYEFVDSDTYSETIHYVRDGRRNVLILRTFSKVYGLAGIRLGYGIGHPDVLACLHQVKEPFAVNLLAQAAGLAALEDTAFLEQTVARNREERHFLYEALTRMGLSYVPSHTNFVSVEIGPQAGDVIQGLLEMGVIVRPCVAYDLPDFARVTIGDRAQNERFIHSLELILDKGE
jgi:histidinol-phosphate aminotransferase